LIDKLKLKNNLNFQNENSCQLILAWKSFGLRKIFYKLKMIGNYFK